MIACLVASAADALYVPYTSDFDAMMARRGWRKGKDYQSLAFPGEGHSETAWAKRLEFPLEFLLAPPR